MEAKEIEKLVQAQRQFFSEGNTRPLQFRLQALKRLKAAIEQNQGKIEEALIRDLHKAPLETYMCETGFVLDEIGYHLKHLEEWVKSRPVSTPLAQFPSDSFVLPEPYGVALIMSPWNYPFQLTLEPLIGAISAGNCAVLKPSAYAPATSKLIAALIAKIFPPQYITVVEGGREENTHLLEQKFDYIFFTGSVAVGKVVMEAASKHLTPVSLELGGKSPVIVAEDANVKIAARRIAFGKVLNAGQTCVAPDYAFVHESLLSEFLDEFQDALEEFFPGKDYHQMVRIISEKHYKQKKELLKDVDVVIGGGYDDETRFMEPTVVLDPPLDSPLMTEEIFAPILPVIPFKELSEATDFICGRPKPLAFYLFTESRYTEKTVFERCSFGGGCVNDTIIHLATPNMPFGGVGESGMGAYHGKASFDTFTHYRSVVRKSTKVDIMMRYFPYTRKKLALIKKFLK
jgi:aldehyde dehydrogenase (NAD+)